MFCEIVLSSSHECGREIIVWAPAAVSRLSNLHYKTSSKFVLFGCPEGVKLIIFRGPHVRLVFDRQTTDFLLKNGPQNGPQNH